MTPNTPTGTQNANILAYLKEGHTLTGLEALTRFGCIHLPRRILDLKERGHKIADRWVKDERTGKRFKEWFLG